MVSSTTCNVIIDHMLLLLLQVLLLLNYNLSDSVGFRGLSELSSEVTSSLKFESILWDNFVT